MCFYVCETSKIFDLQQPEQLQGEFYIFFSPVHEVIMEVKIYGSSVAYKKSEPNISREKMKMIV